MDSAKNLRWIIPFKKFGMKRVKLTSSSELKTGYLSVLWHLKFSNRFENTGKWKGSEKDEKTHFEKLFQSQSKLKSL